MFARWDKGGAGVVGSPKNQEDVGASGPSTDPEQKSILPAASGPLNQLIPGKNQWKEEAGATP